MSGGKLLALDVTGILALTNKTNIQGDFTKVNLSGIYRHYLHGCQHSDDQNKQKQELATPKNERTNLDLLRAVENIIVHGAR